MSTTNNSSIVQTYLNFDGRSEEAITYYQSALGAKLVMLMRFKDSPEPPQPGCMAPGSENKVMHAQFTIGGSTLMASDCHCAGQPNFQGFSLSFVVPTVAEAEKAFAALADGGKVNMPLAKTFFSESFGVVVDRFGLNWMVLVTPPTAPA